MSDGYRVWICVLRVRIDPFNRSHALPRLSINYRDKKKNENKNNMQPTSETDTNEISIPKHIVSLHCSPPDAIRGKKRKRNI